MNKKTNFVTIEPMFFVTLGFILCFLGILFNKSQEIHDASLALISGGMGAYGMAISSPQTTTIDTTNSIDSLGNINNNNDDSVLITNKDYSEHE